MRVQYCGGFLAFMAVTLPGCIQLDAWGGGILMVELNRDFDSRLESGRAYQAPYVGYGCDQDESFDVEDQKLRIELYNGARLEPPNLRNAKGILRSDHDATPAHGTSPGSLIAIWDFPQRYDVKIGDETIVFSLAPGSVSFDGEDVPAGTKLSRKFSYESLGFREGRWSSEPTERILVNETLTVMNHGEWQNPIPVTRGGRCMS